ncbi:PAS domain S-box protein [Terriglobus albidus]|uniref:histidine kinase n=2 Tax=Terriglobus albidus TaxID=1592106 RepID=A0A5B9EHG5_9BACT|nr:PAS domain S-box protein [Terriglobus albidus]
MDKTPKSSGTPIPATWVDPERWLAAIVESSDTAIMGESLDGMITSWNRAAVQMFGYSAEEAIGKPVFFLAWPGEDERMHELLRIVRNGERIDGFETARRHKDGSQVFVSLSMFPVKDADGTIVGIAEIARNITDRRLAEEQIARSHAEVLAERKFREMIEEAPDAILEVNQTGYIVIANKTSETLFGYTREELLGQPVEILVPMPHRGNHADNVARFVRSGKTRPMGQGLDLNARRKDGSEFPVEISLSPIRSAQEVLIVVVIRDVSERRKAEQQLRALQEGYFNELVARQHEAERLNRLKSEFMASVSHELRTPLHTIIGFTDLLKEESNGTLNAKQTRFVEHIQRDSEHLLALINDVLDLSRIEAGGLSLQTEQIDVTDLLHQTTESVRGQAAAKGIILQTEYEADLYASADRTRVRQVLLNLLSNAIKFTPAGGSVTITTAIEDEWIRISVRDTGIGIAPEEHELIFDKFYQAAVTTGGVKEGTGLGLTISRQIVMMHGGRLEVNSTEGAGSEFTFTLPQWVQ